MARIVHSTAIPSDGDIAVIQDVQNIHNKCVQEMDRRVESACTKISDKRFQVF